MNLPSGVKVVVLVSYRLDIVGAAGAKSFSHNPKRRASQGGRKKKGVLVQFPSFGGVL